MKSEYYFTLAKNKIKAYSLKNNNNNNYFFLQRIFYESHNCF